MDLKNTNILVVDDEKDAALFIAKALERRGATVQTALSAVEALEKLKKSEVDICLTDMRMPDMDGLELLKNIKNRYPSTEVVVFTAYASVGSAVEAMRRGAFDYIPKPVEPEELFSCLEKIQTIRRLGQENRLLRQQLDEHYGYMKIVGEHPSMREVKETIKTVARSDSTVLISGESGTGKELVAYALHYQSPRSGKPFIKVSCGVFSDELLGSELFGHEKGAFTGAIQRHKGRFELADSGTLFLDEIGDASPNIQKKLLRVIDKQEFERVGGTQTIRCDVRLIFATNKDLEEEVRKGNFREDLYFRLKVIPIKLPPLRQRTSDIPLLVDHFIEKYSRETNKKVTGISDEALELLCSYAWPGNVRELENTIERAIVMTKGQTIEVPDLPDDVVLNSSLQVIGEEFSLAKAKENFERRYLENALRKDRGNISKTAQRIRLSRKNLYQKIVKYGIELEKYK
ncbi:MAG: sigma-54-dependent Fis family transcriptional regulator [Candidatus Latescibacteria bacterium]|nr:sigma-54-dependent Fis family transcriptional regulator [Candidatus Latescibacterota bacterium]